MKVILEKSNPNAERGAVARRVVSVKVAVRELILDRGNQVKVKHLDGSPFELPEAVKKAKAVVSKKVDKPKEPKKDEGV